MLADRVDGRTLLLRSQLGLLAVVVATLVLLGMDRLNYGWVLVLSVFSGIAQAFGHPVRQALIPLLVPDRLLMNAVALNALAMTSSMILSAPLVKITGDLFDFEGVYALQVVMLVATWIGSATVFYYAWNGWSFSQASVRCTHAWSVL